MKVLYLMPVSPVPADFGGALRMFHLLKQLATRHDVTVLANGSQEQAATLKREIPSLREVRFLKPAWQNEYRRLGQLYSTVSLHSHLQLAVASERMQRELHAMAREERFDVVQTEFSHLGPFELPEGALKIVDAHNVEADVYRRMSAGLASPVRKAFYLLEYQKIRRDELATCRHHDALLATSERDSELFGRDLPTMPRWVVPNGVDTQYFTPSDAPPEPHSLVFTGMMSYVPNLEGITWFLDEIFPLIERQVPDVKLSIVGKNPPASLKARATDRITVTGTVPDVRPYVHRAAVCVVPLRMGGGTRLKIVEALAAKKAVVSTRVGCEGIDLVDGESARLADAPAEFADAVVELLRDAKARTKIAEAGLELARSRFDWSAIGAQLEDIYQSLFALRSRFSRSGAA